MVFCHASGLNQQKLGFETRKNQAAKYSNKQKQNLHWITLHTELYKKNKKKLNTWYIIILGSY